MLLQIVLFLIKFTEKKYCFYVSRIYVVSYTHFMHNDF